MKKQELPLRTGVGIIVLNSDNKIFVGKRKDNPGNKWQMPQGGVDIGENFITAMKRELAEETSIRNIKIIKEIEKIYQYELPKNLNTKNAEFIDWKWIEPKMLPEIIVSFKRDLYINLLKEINLVIG